MEGESDKRRSVPGDPRLLGVTCTAEGVNFAVNVADDLQASLILYQKGTNHRERISLDNENRVGNIRTVQIKDLPADAFEYNYEIDGKIVQDPYARVINGREKFGEAVDSKDPHAVRCGFSATGFAWGESDMLFIPWEKTILYKLHVRGFTMQKNSRVRQKGTFMGVQQKIPYLKDLGINAVELLPAYEFNEVIRMEEASHEYQYWDGESPRINYWGFAGGFYFAPKKAYCHTSDPVREFRMLVRELHENDIECIMDFYFPAHTAPALALSALRFWKYEYHVDGFHLMGDGVPVEMIVRDPLFTRTKLIFANVEGGAIQVNGLPKCKNIAECNDGFQNDVRRLLKSDEDQLQNFAYRMRRNPPSCGIVNYVADQNGFTLADLFCYERKHNAANGEDNRDGTNYNYSWNCGEEGPSRKLAIRRLRRQQMKNAILCLCFAASAPMLCAGDEFGNSQDGNNNAYCQDNEIGWINWGMQKRNQDFTDFIRGAIAFRRRHPILHPEKELRIMDYKSVGYPDLSYHSRRAWYAQFDNTSRHIGLMYCGKYARDEDGKADDFLYIAFNFYWDPREFALPHLPEGQLWYEVVNTADAQGFCEPGEERLLKDQKMMTVAARAVSVLLGRTGE